MLKDCPDCKGSGRKGRAICKNCKGCGAVEVPKAPAQKSPEKK